MQSVAKAGRRPAAILFADMDASTPLSKRLPTATYFTFGRRLMPAADRCVIDAGGLIGRHAGDGVVPLGGDGSVVMVAYCRVTAEEARPRRSPLPFTAWRRPP
jgi:class 3 adenylate cyclase